MKDFTGLSPITKVIRMGLQPTPETRRYIQANGFLQEDEQRASNYLIVKDLLDKCHKDFIEKTLGQLDRLLPVESIGKKNSLSEYNELYRKNNRTDSEKKDLETIQENMRKTIAKVFKEGSKTIPLFSEKIFNTLHQYADTEEEIQAIASFKGFTTYFTGYHENRKNLYSEKAITSSIAYRLVHENLNRFIDNSRTYEARIKPCATINLQPALTEMGDRYRQLAIQDIFHIAFYNRCVSQSQIDTYNEFIGRLNQIINEHNQIQKERGDKLPKLKTLHKQILSDRETIFEIPRMFKNSAQLLECIKQVYEQIDEHILRPTTHKPLGEIMQSLSEYDLKGLFIKNDRTLHSLSQLITGDFHTFKDAIITNYKQQLPSKKRETYEKYEERIDKAIKSADSFSIAYLNALMEDLAKQNREREKEDNEDTVPKAENKENSTLPIEQRLSALFLGQEGFPQRIQEAYADIEGLLNKEYSADKDLRSDKENAIRIKKFLDILIEMKDTCKYLIGHGDETEKDETFYGEFLDQYEQLNALIIPLYNSVRNYITQKPYSTEKIKLNFKRPTLLNGWDKNKEKDNLCVILRKQGKYYLGIIN